MNAEPVPSYLKYSDLNDYIGGGHTWLSYLDFKWRSPDQMLSVIARLVSEPNARCMRCNTPFTDMVRPNCALILHHDLGTDWFMESVYLVCDSCWPQVESAVATGRRPKIADADPDDLTSRMLREVYDIGCDLSEPQAPVLARVVWVSGFGKGLEVSNLDLKQL